MTLRTALLTMLFLASGAQAEIFKCERADGSVEFRATRCPIESSETEFTNTGIRTEHTREAVSETEPAAADVTPEAEPEPTLSAETGSAFAELCRKQIARLERMKVLGQTDDDSAMSPAEFDEYVKGFEAQISESCEQYL